MPFKSDKQVDKKKADIDKTYKNIPVFAFIDWADNGAPLAVFSQELSSEEQSNLLIKANDFYSSKGINFIYPVHGGNMGGNAKTLAYGQYGWYDSLAPEFDTYETIKELAQNKK